MNDLNTPQSREKKFSNLHIIQHMEKSIEVMFNAGTWLHEIKQKPSKYWHPKNMNRHYLEKYADSDEFYVATIDGQAAASVILQETERNQSWKYIDKKNPQPALYIHWLCVDRKYAGKGLSDIMIDFAKQQAVKRGFENLRLDTHANENKLCHLYESLGFQLMGIDGENTAYYQLKTTYNP
jgi:ribosomal protein S18 acetylase RimI-like enzyme